MSGRKNDQAKYRRSVRFVLDGEIIEIEDPDPTRTVLQYLREDLRRSGTKEGCAEGDCGACTVVIADIDESGNRLRARAVNSCIQFLPTLDGKELLTVESLAGQSGHLHPVQSAMVDCHGSQCGFCTPGFVMSLFALYKNNPDPTRREIDEALAGNLCRCTGYSPIVDAANDMYKNLPDGGDWQVRPANTELSDDEANRVEKLRALKAGESICVERNGRKFFAPQSLPGFAELVIKFPGATILAGGTDIGLWVTKQHRDLGVVIYTGRVTELGAASVTASHLDIGASVTLTDAIPLIVEHYPALEELFVRFASPPIRNAATLGGNIASGSPIGDSMPALLVLNSGLVLRKGGSTRSVALADFYLGYQQTALQEGEFIERILIPLPAAATQVRSYKVAKRFDQDISAVCAAFALRLEGSTVAEIRVAYGGMAAVPARAPKCEGALLGGEWSEDIVDAAMLALDEDFAPISDLRSSGEYRRQVSKNLLKRFYLETTSSEAVRVYSYGR